MRNRIRHIIWGSGVVLCMLSCSYSFGQDNRSLSLDNVFEIVRKYHPVALQANLKNDSAQAIQQMARGAFDPLAVVENEQKTFAGTNYYFYTQAGVKVPTWYGIEVKAGIEDNGGSRLFSEVTPGQSSYAGISMPLLKGLVLDKRRAALQQSKILANQTEAERRNVYNDLLYDVAATYWEWVKTYQLYSIISQAVVNNEKRFQFVSRLYAGGDRAAIDTVEALTQLQNFQFLQSEAYYNFQSAALDLSVFLWLPNQVPYQLEPGVLPDSTWQQIEVEAQSVPAIEDLVVTAKTQHPKLQSLGFKRDLLQIDKRLKTQSLLPTLNVNYNFLQKGYEPWKGLGQYFLQNNYKYGFDFKMPLFLREARGELKLANIKIRGNELQQSQASLEIENKIRNYFNQVLAYRRQIAIYDDALKNYQQLLVTEEYKFSIGESSLFLLNSRENKVLETRQKVAELKTKFFKSNIALQWAAGALQ